MIALSPSSRLRRLRASPRLFAICRSTPVQSLVSSVAEVLRNTPRLLHETRRITTMHAVHITDQKQKNNTSKR
jgi:hypothetical protein